MSGWYLMHRGWMDNSFFRNEVFNRRDAFLWMIEEAAFRPHEITICGRPVQIDRGQFSHSIRHMAGIWKWDEKKVRRFLASAQKAEIIAASTAAGQCVITICNYEKYQAPEKNAAAPDAAPTPQERRGDAAKKKEGKEIKEGEGANAPRAGGDYAFAGRVIRLNREHYDEWKARYHAIPDFDAELASLDAWYQTQPDDKRRNWFFSVQGSLNRKHQEALRAGTGQKTRSQELQNVFDMADAAERRRLRWEQSQREQAERENVQ